MRTKKSFLENKEKEHNFNAFDVINIMVFIGVLAAFMISFVFSIYNIINTENKSFVPVVEAILGIVALILPFTIKKIFKISYPKLATIFYYLFLFISIFLGSCINLYNKFAFWDIIVNFIGAILIGFLSLFFLNLYNKKPSKSLNPFLIFLFVFIFSLAFGVILEVFEFVGDLLFGLNLQEYLNSVGETLSGQKALFDTMFDLLTNLCGAFISALICLVCSYINKDFITKFKITKIRKEKISQIEE